VGFRAVRRRAPAGEATVLPVQVTNTISRRKEAFIPVREGKVGIYVCGPTVYGPAHLGHARTAMAYDVIVKFLRYAGYDVTYVSNITDVGHLTDDADSGEDKVEKEAKKRKVDPLALATAYMNEYFEDMEALGVSRPDHAPRATDHIPAMISLVERLLGRGYGYEVDGTVYYEVRKFLDYGRLSRKKLEEQVAGARVEVDEAKRDPLDFALWFRSPPEHILKWDSPWGRGYPGWHIECSAMSMQYLGETLDIHGGAIELSFPHHENEIAQSEGATGRPFVKYWVHSGLVEINGQKMAKSLGNFVTVKDLLTRCDPEAFRLFCLGTAYRSPIDYTDDAITAAAGHLDRLTETILAVRRRPAAERGAESILETIAASRAAFEAAMQDDFNTPKAVAELLAFTRQVNAALSGGGPLSLPVKDAILGHFGVFGRVLGVPRRALAADLSEFAEAVPADVLALVAERQEARKRKDFAAADRLRDEIAARGYVVKDTPQGPQVRRVS
jgi:cysteinyl-tRNA synthetase